MIHYYFDNKEKLFQSVLDHVFGDIMMLIEQVLATPRSHREGVEFFYRGFFEFIDKHRNFSRLSTMAVGSPGDYFEQKIRQNFTPLFNRSIRFLEEGIEKGVFRPIDVKSFLLSMYSMTVSIFSDAHFLGILTDEDTSDATIRARFDCLLDILLTTLGVQPTAGDVP